MSPEKYKQICLFRFSEDRKPNEMSLQTTPFRNIMTLTLIIIVVKNNDNNNNNNHSNDIYIYVLLNSIYIYIYILFYCWIYGRTNYRPRPNALYL